MTYSRDEALKEMARRELESRKKNSPESQWQTIQQEHPYLAKISEHLQNMPRANSFINSLGPSAENMQYTISRMGLPSVASGILQGGSNIIRGIGNAIPKLNIPEMNAGGVNIPSPNPNQESHANIPNPNFTGREVPYVNKDVNSIMQGLGTIGSELIPVQKIQQGIEKGIELAPYLNKAPKAIKSILAGAGTGAAISPEHRGLGAAIGGAVSSIPGLIEGGKNIYNWTQSPKKILSEHEGLVEKLKNLLSGKSENLKPLEESMPNLGQAQSFENLTNEASRKYKQLEGHFNEQYNNFYKSEAGQKPISEPFKVNEINNTLKGIPGVKPTTRKMGNNISETKVELSLIDPSTGKNFEIIYPAKNAKVEDYLKFSQQAGSAAHIAHNEAKYSVNLSTGEKQKLFSLSNKLKELKDKVEIKAKNEIPEEFKNYELIKTDYKNLMVPLKKHESPILHKLTQKKRIAGDIQKELSQNPNKHVRDFLLSDPAFKNSLVSELLRGGKHPMASKSLQGQGNAVEQLLLKNPDAFKLLTPKQQKLLLKQKELSEQTESQLKSLKEKTAQKKYDVTKRKVQVGAALTGLGLLGGGTLLNKVRNFLQ